jgi:Calcineurin-like phosphoesterase superfamily domain
MRLAVLADVHGNFQALEAVLEHAKKQNVDDIIIAGDLMIGLADSRACWELVTSRNIKMIRGNHERYLVDYGTERLDFSGERFGPVAWTAKQFSQEEKQQIETLPRYLCFDNLLIVHASYRNDTDAVKPTTPVNELETMFAPSTETYIIRAHNHVKFSLSFKGRHLESIGSAGLPLDGLPKADYVVLEQTKDAWNVTRHALDYDIKKAEKRLTETGYLEEAGPMAKLFLQELLTSRLQLTPFLKTYEKQNETMTLEQAVNAYLAG